MSVEKDRQSTFDNISSRKWLKSSRCNASECVEIALSPDHVAIRDSKLGDDSPVLTFDKKEWTAFLEGAALGEFHPPNN